jgi:hypothetical protein
MPYDPKWEQQGKERERERDAGFEKFDVETLLSLFNIRF